MPVVLREVLQTYDQLKYGIRRTQVVGIVSIFFSVLAMFFSVIILHQRNELANSIMRVLKIRFENCGTLKHDYIKSAVINTGAAMYALAVASILTAVILLIGVHKRINKLMIPWLVFNGLMIGCGIYFGVYLLCLAFVGPPRMYWPLFFTVLLVLIGYVQMFKVVCLLFRSMDRLADIAEQHATEMELQEFTNSDDDAQSNKSNVLHASRGQTAVGPLGQLPQSQVLVLPQRRSFDC